MKYFISIVVSCVINHISLAQTGSPDTNQFSLCADKWKYFELEKQITGQVIEHAKAGPCGNIAFASITIIKLLPNDTIRVLELCNDEKYFQYNQTVTVAPAKKPPFGVSLPLIVEDHESVAQNIYCRILKTCYGSVTLTK